MVRRNAQKLFLSHLKPILLAPPVLPKKYTKEIVKNFVVSLPDQLSLRLSRISAFYIILKHSSFFTLGYTVYL
jgi:hypothetical protein